MSIKGIKVRVDYKHIRHLYLRIDKQGDVKVSASMSITEKQITDFIDVKKNWIKHCRFIILKHISKSQSHDPKYTDVFIYQGQKLHLLIKPTTSKKSIVFLDLKDSKIILQMHSPSSPETIQKILDKWQRQEFTKILTPLTKKWEELMGLQAREYRIRKMTTRWGTCNPLAKRIWLNIELLKKPKICLEYIIVHELAHLIERSHNHRFRAVMSQYLPNWREYRKLLNNT